MMSIRTSALLAAEKFATLKLRRPSSSLVLPNSSIDRFIAFTVTLLPIEERLLDFYVISNPSEYEIYTGFDAGVGFSVCVFCFIVSCIDWT